jgi:hypothetical protein
LVIAARVQPPQRRAKRARSQSVTAHEKVDPLAVLPTLNKLVDADVDHVIRELRETHRRRPRLQQEFDRAGLP